MLFEEDSIVCLCLTAKLKPNEIAWMLNIAGGLACEKVEVVSIEKNLLMDECIRLLKD
jgi:hypothetical protein